MSKRERILLIVLLWTAVAAALGVFFFLEVMRRQETEGSIVLLEEQLERFATRIPSEKELLSLQESLAAELVEVKGRFYAADAIDPYGFGIIIRDLLTENDLAIERYQTIEVGDEALLEFSVRGDALGFIAFLKSVSISPKYWSILFLSINARGEGGDIHSVFRIRYEYIDKEDS